MKKETIEKGNIILKEIETINQKIDTFNRIAEDTFSINFHEEENKIYCPIFEIKKMKENKYSDICFPSVDEFFDFWKSKLVAHKKELELKFKNLKD
jgi:murein L,D-transpeptidase YafK